MSNERVSRNPYHDGHDKPQLKQSVLIFMDILGYAEMTSVAHNDGRAQEFLENLYDVLAEGRRSLEEGYWLPEGLEGIVQKDRSYLKAFTDNIVIGLPIRDDAEIELGDAFSRVAEFQLTMAIHGFFVRGAISLGSAYVDEIAVFGEALMEAYKGEAYLARDPRVILTASAVKSADIHLEYYGRGDHAPQVRDLLKDSDGQWFVSYLEEILIAEGERGPNYGALSQHKEATERKLAQYRDRPPIFSKYAWVADYHNYFCDAYPQYSFDEYKIDTDIFRAPFQRIID
ncbi:MAG: hypothetical protein KF899_03840 [Parvibaculum sp.]|nr:hypothetical protein [Parvibaculum sp.]